MQMSEGFHLVTSCAFGGAVGACLAHYFDAQDIFGYFWLLGPVLGVVAGYLSYDTEKLKVAATLLLTITAFTTVVTTITMYVSLIVTLFVFDGQVSTVEFFTTLFSFELLFAHVPYFIIFSLVFTPVAFSNTNDDDFKGGYSYLLTMIAITNVFTAWITLLALTVWYIRDISSFFISTAIGLFEFISSRQRTLCCVSSFIGGMTGWLLTNDGASGALVGGAAGFAAAFTLYQIINPRMQEASM